MAEPVHSSPEVTQLIGEVERLRALLSAHAGEGSGAREAAKLPDEGLLGADRVPTALDRLVAVFDLSPFERDVLLLCAGCELDAPFAALCRRASVDPSRLRPVVGLVMACLPGARWGALAPHAPLRHYQLLRVHNERAIADAELTIDEAVLHYLLDGYFWDASLDLAVEPLEPNCLTTASQVSLASRILGVWNQAPPGPPPIVQLVTADARAGLDLIAGLAEQLQATALRIDAALLPASPQELQAKLLAWERLHRTAGAIGVVDAASQSPDRALASDALAGWLEGSTGPTVLLTRTRRAPGARTWITFELAAPEPHEQVELWTAEISRSLGDQVVARSMRASQLEDVVERLVGSFNLTAGRIRSACADARGLLAAQPRSADAPSISFPDALWQACRVQARPDLDAYAQRLTSQATFEDLCVEPRTLSTLRKICDQVRYQGVVHGRWGVGGKSRRGLGVTALFAGASGTGKTLAAEVIGNELGLDVYRIDLSAVVSKYIGETEKNLGRVFDAAEGSGVVLLFDEADALFGKRTEVKDSHDRHANVEIGYLLQRIEAYQGLAILTTNLREDLDKAFLRRLRFTVEFVHPSAQQRLELWRDALGGRLPVEALDHEALARVPLTGGQIRNVVLNAAFAAAALGRAVDAELLREAIVQELEKNGQRLGQGDLWGLAKPAQSQLARAR